MRKSSTRNDNNCNDDERNDSNGNANMSHGINNDSNMRNESMNNEAQQSATQSVKQSAMQFVRQSAAQSDFSQAPHSAGESFPAYETYRDEISSSDSLPPLLLGTYTPKVDAKGRLALPAKMRSLLGGGVVMTRGQERCIYLLSRHEFCKIAAQIQRTSLGNRAAREYLRIFLSGATDEDFDKQGRIMIPQMLKKYASLESEVVVIGVGTRAEVWDKAMWEEYLDAKEQDYADIAQDVLPDVDW